MKVMFLTPKKIQKFISFAMISLLLSFAASSLLFNTEDHEFVAWMRQTNNIYTGDDYHFRLCIYSSAINATSMNSTLIQQTSSNSV